MDSIGSNLLTTSALLLCLSQKFHNEILQDLSLTVRPISLVLEVEPLQKNLSPENCTDIQK